MPARHDDITHKREWSTGPLGDELPRLHQSKVGYRVKYGSGPDLPNTYWPEPSEWETGDNPVVAAVLRATERPVSELDQLPGGHESWPLEFTRIDRNYNARSLYSWVNRTLKERTEI
jgi:hypothetical protein